MTTADISRQAETIVKTLNGLRRTDPSLADDIARANLVAFIAYWRAHYGSPATIRLLDDLADHEIGKAYAR